MDRFDLPESLTDLDLDALAALADSGVAAYQALGLTEDSDEDTITEAERIVAAVRAVRAEATRRETAKETARGLISEMTAPVATEKKKADDDDEPEAPPEAEPFSEPVPVVPVNPVDEDGNPITEGEAAVVAEAQAITENAPEPVTAAAEHPAAVAARTAPAPLLPKEKNVTISLTAAADVPGFSTGARLESMADVTQGVLARMKSFPTGAPNAEVFNRYGTAMLTIGGFEGLRQDDFRDDEDLLREATRQSRLPGGSLIAAGGWCAPSETLYDLCDGEAADNLLSLPEVQVTRGGIRYTKGIDFSAVFTGVGFRQTEAQAIAGTAKTVYDVVCPSFVDVRLDAIGIIVRAPILTNAAYPELIQNIIAKSLVAHEMKVNAGVIASIKTALGAALTPVDQKSTISTLESLAWVAEGLRRKYGYPESAVIETILPSWLKISLREDLARRQGSLDATVSDAELNAWFADRRLAVQFVIGLSDLNVSGALPVKPPATADVLMYPAGSFVKGTSAVISLDSVYDATNLVNNVYTAVFFEEGILVANKCAGGALVTIPVADTGRSGAASLVSAFGTVEA